MVELYKIVISLSARKQLRSIFNFLKENTSSQIAHKVRSGLLDETKKLEKMPSANPLFLPNKTPYRFRNKWSYKVVFRILEEEKVVRVIDFAHKDENPKEIEKRLK